jgi:hypothetical protein
MLDQRFSIAVSQHTGVSRKLCQVASCHCHWRDQATNPRRLLSDRLPVTTVTELTGTLNSLIAGTDAPGHCQRRDRATNPRILRSARLPVTTVTELTGTLSSMPARTSTPGHCHWLDCATNPHPSER